MRDRVTEAILLVLGVLMGIPVGVIITNWPTTSTTFFEIRLVQIIQLVLTVLLAVFIAYIVQSSVRKDLRRLEMISEVINTFQNMINEIFNLGDSYIRKPNREKQREILGALKKAGNKLSVIKDMKEHTAGRKFIKYEGHLTKDFWAFKRALTESPFGAKHPKYKPEDYRKFQSKYMLLSGRLHKTMFTLYD